MPLPAAEPTTLAGKTCLVTGGAGGLGKAIVTAFLKADANVIMCDINQERLKETSTELAGAGSLTAIRADITNSAEVEDLFTEIAGKFPTLDVLVNNAAIMDRFDPVAELDLELWDKVLSVNLTAPFLMTKLALRAMLQQPNSNGCIINIASGSAKAGWLAGTAYTASKHGLIGLTKSTSSFYGAKGIRCNALLCGMMDTNITDSFQAGCNAEGRRKVMDILSGSRPQQCRVEDVAGFCLYLAHGAGSNAINGACIAIDHGWTSIVG